MRQPCGFVQRGSEGKVCRLNRSLYGLKQATRTWNQKLHEELVRQRFQRCDSDPCLYRKQVKGRWCYVLVYVDDLVVMSEDPTIIEALARKLKKSFEISKLDDIRYYLGMKVEREEMYRPVIGRNSLHAVSNENGQRCVNFAASRGMVVRSTFFPRKDIHKATWRSPDHETENQIDHVLIDGKFFSNITNVRTAVRI